MKQSRFVKLATGVVLLAVAALAWADVEHSRKLDRGTSTVHRANVQAGDDDNDWSAPQNAFALTSNPVLGVGASFSEGYDGDTTVCVKVGLYVQSAASITSYLHPTIAAIQTITASWEDINGEGYYLGTSRIAVNCEGYTHADVRAYDLTGGSVTLDITTYAAEPTGGGE